MKIFLRSILYFCLLSGTRFILNVNGAGSYSPCWIKKGECLDQNVGPLLRTEKPLDNPNVIDNAIYNITSVDDCSKECSKKQECKYFTWYDNSTKEEDKNHCELVGFNLRQACFNLNNVCVLIRHCSNFSTTCKTCQTGIRSYLDLSADESAVLIFHGVKDNPQYKLNPTLKPLSEGLANITEFLYKNNSCDLKPQGTSTPRTAPAGAYIKGSNKVLSCGGYQYSTNKYVDICESFDGTTWSGANALKSARAFASAVPVKKGATKLLMMGGFNGKVFLDSIETFDGTSWTTSGITIPTARSHFCSLIGMNDTLYVIGGWNEDGYLNDFNSISMDVTSGNPTGKWIKIDKPLIQRRADMACMEAQVGWSYGIIVSGGYDIEGAWKRSVEFFDYMKGEWRSLEHFAKLSQGRHNHGIAILNWVPTVFAGWSNGTVSTLEYLDECAGYIPKWKPTKFELKVSREKFGYAVVPKSFATCP